MQYYNMLQHELTLKTNMKYPDNKIYRDEEDERLLRAGG